jgi:anthranilate phosphoribosyltransferase
MSAFNEKIMETLLEKKDLSSNDVRELLDSLFAGQFSHVQAAAILLLWRAKGETEKEIATAAEAILARANSFEQPGVPLSDIVGTGGDGRNTINISTMASLVAATRGLDVAKHGNVSVSSKCGSADVLRALGLNIESQTKRPEESIKKFHWGFIFAPLFHPAFLAVKALRQELRVKTIFNILGPLVNPSRPDYMVLGVFDPHLIVPIANALKHLHVKRALVVNGSGLDEIAIHAETKCALLDQGQVSTFTWQPADLGLSTHPLNDLVGQGPKRNAEIFSEVIAGQGHAAHAAATAANAGALLWVAGKVDNIKMAVQAASESLALGEPMKLFAQIREFYHDA